MVAPDWLAIALTRIELLLRAPVAKLGPRALRHELAMIQDNLVRHAERHQRQARKSAAAATTTVYFVYLDDDVEEAWARHALVDVPRVLDAVIIGDGSGAADAEPFLVSDVQWIPERNAAVVVFYGGTPEAWPVPCNTAIAVQRGEGPTEFQRTQKGGA